MGFKLVNGQWNRTHARKAASIFKARLVDGTEYTTEELIAVLAAEGLVYSVSEFQQIRQELFSLGVLEGEEDPPPE